MSVLQLLQMINRLGKALAERTDGVGIGHDVGVVEAVEGHVQFLDEGQRSLPLGTRRRRIVCACMPGATEGAGAEHIAARPAEAMPEADRKAQMLFHALAQDDLVLVVPAIGEVVITLRPLVGDGREFSEITGGHEFLLTKT